MTTIADRIKEVHARLAESDYDSALRLVQEPIRYGWNIDKNNLIIEIHNQSFIRDVSGESMRVPNGFFSMMTAFIKADPRYRNKAFELFKPYTGGWQTVLAYLTDDFRSDKTNKEYCDMLAALLNCTDVNYADRVLEMLKTKNPYGYGHDSHHILINHSAPEGAAAFLEMLKYFQEKEDYSALLSILSLRDSKGITIASALARNRTTCLGYIELLRLMTPHVPAVELLKLIDLNFLDSSSDVSKSPEKAKLSFFYFELFTTFIEKGEAARVVDLLLRGNFLFFFSFGADSKSANKFFDILDSLIGKVHAGTIIGILGQFAPHWSVHEEDINLLIRYFNFLKNLNTRGLIDSTSLSRLLINRGGRADKSGPGYIQMNIGQKFLYFHEDLSLHKAYLDLLSLMKAEGAFKVLNERDFHEVSDDDFASFSLSTFELLAMSKNEEVVALYFDWFETALDKGHSKEVLAFFSIHGSSGVGGGPSLVCHQTAPIIRRYLNILIRCAEEAGHSKEIKELLQQVTVTKTVIAGHRIEKGAGLAHIGLQAAKESLAKLIFWSGYCNLLKKLPLEDQTQLLNLKNAAGDSCLASTFKTDPDLALELLWPFMMDKDYKKLDYTSLAKLSGFKEKLCAELLSEALPKNKRDYYAFAALRQEGSALYQIFHTARGVTAVDENREGSTLNQLKNALEASIPEKTELLLALPSVELQEINLGNFEDKLGTIHIVTRIGMGGSIN